jgi:hypothetical protein
MSPTASGRNAVVCDERTVAVENAGYRWACTFMSFGLLLAACYRSFVLHESTWDLLALVILGGGVGTTYQATHKILGRRWLVVFVSAFVVGAVIAALIALVRR